LIADNPKKRLTNSKYVAFAEDESVYQTKTITDITVAAKNQSAF
jgi:hypothetical protein